MGLTAAIWRYRRSWAAQHPWPIEPMYEYNEVMVLPSAPVCCILAHCISPRRRHVDLICTAQSHLRCTWRSLYRIHVLSEVVLLCDYRPASFIQQHRLARASNPLRIVYSGNRVRLFTEPWLRMPTLVEKNKHHLQVVLLGNIKKCLETLKECFRILHPDENMKKNPQDIHV